MPSIHDLFEIYLKAADLRGRAVPVIIANASVVDVFNPRARKNVPSLAVRFVGKSLTFLVNKTQAVAIANATGTNDYTKWAGHHIVLAPAIAPTGAATIAILPPADAGAPPPPAEPAAQVDAATVEPTTPEAPPDANA